MIVVVALTHGGQIRLSPEVARVHRFYFAFKLGVFSLGKA